MFFVQLPAGRPVAHTGTGASAVQKHGHRVTSMGIWATAPARTPGRSSVLEKWNMRSVSSSSWPVPAVSQSTPKRLASTRSLQAGMQLGGKVRRWVT